MSAITRCILARGVAASRRALAISTEQLGLFRVLSNKRSFSSGSYYTPRGPPPSLAPPISASSTSQCQPATCTPRPCDPSAPLPAPCREGRVRENDQFECSGFKLYEGSTCAPVDLDAIFCGKKVLIVGVPGAFTPDCSNHLPNYVLHQKEFNCKGVHEVLFVSVNDAYVMDAWGKAYKADGKVRMIADPDGSFTKALGMDIDLCSSGLGDEVRSRNYAMLVDDAVVRMVVEEPNGIGYDQTNPKTVLCQVQSIL